MPLINYIGGSLGDDNSQLCEQVDNFLVTTGMLSATITWTIPSVDQNSSFVGTRIVRKEGSKPTSPNDGLVVYEGTELSYTDEGLTDGVTYYYRAFAYNSEGKYQTSERCASVTATNGLSLSGLPEGALLALNESGVAVPFYIAKHDYESGLNGTGRTLLVRKDCLAARVWNEYRINAYASSDISTWLNDTYKTQLDADIQTAIGTTKFYYVPGNGNGTMSTLSRAVFLLSVTELGKNPADVSKEGSALPIASELQIAYRNGSAVNQWTRTPDTDGSTNAYYLGTGGNANSTSCSNTRATRPCFTLPAAELMVSATPDENGYYYLLAD